MNAESIPWTPVGSLDDIPSRGARRVSNATRPIALFRTRDDRVFALIDQCPHAGGPLSQGIVHDGCVTCPLHNWVISLESGEAQGADEGATRTIPIRMEDRQIFIRSDVLTDAGETPTDHAELDVDGTGPGAPPPTSRTGATCGDVPSPSMTR